MAMIKSSIAILSVSSLATLDCTSPQKEQVEYSVAVEVPGGRIERMPCSISDEGVDVRFRHDRLGIFTDYPKGLTRFGAFYGISGAPVFDRNERVVGAIADAFFNRAGPTFGIRAIDSIEQLYLEGATFCRRDSAARFTPDERIGVGSSVVTLEVWGDLVLGTTGRIALLRDSQAVSTAHAISEPRGPWIRAIALAPVAALFLSYGSGMELCSLGPIIGTSTFEGADGAYIQLGLEPPRLDVSFDVRTMKPPLNYCRTYHIARDPSTEMQRVRDVVEHALTARESVEPDEATITIRTAKESRLLGTMRISTGEAAMAMVAAIEKTQTESVDENLAIEFAVQEGGGE